MNFPKISIIYPNLNGSNLAKRATKSFLKSNYPKEKLEIIVVDNGSDSKDIDALLRGKILRYLDTNRNTKLIQNKKNLGFAKAINIGSKMASGNYLFITNNDVEVGKNFFSQLIEFARSNSADICGPDGYKFNLYTGLFRKVKEIEIPDWIPGYALLVKKSVWKKLKGFDEDFFFTFEDLDLCRRASNLDYKISLCPSVSVKHHEGLTVNRRENLEFKYYQGYKSKIRFILKHGNLFQKITSLTLQYLIFAPYRFIILKEPSGGALLRATWSIINEKN